MKKRCEQCGCEMDCCKCNGGMGKHKACCCKGVTRIISALIIAGSLVYVGYAIKGGGCMMHGDMMKVEKK